MLFLSLRSSCPYDVLVVSSHSPFPSTLFGLLGRWMAPEVLAQEEATCAADVWSFGVLLYELANNADALPFAALSNAAVVAAVQEGRRLDVLGDAPEAVSRLIDGCMCLDRTQRPAFTELHDMLHTLAVEEDAQQGQRHVSAESGNRGGPRQELTLAMGGDIFMLPSAVAGASESDADGHLGESGVTIGTTPLSVSPLQAAPRPLLQPADASPVPPSQLHYTPHTEMASQRLLSGPAVTTARYSTEDRALLGDPRAEPHTAGAMAPGSPLLNGRHDRYNLVDAAGLRQQRLYRLAGSDPRATKL